MAVVMDSAAILQWGSADVGAQTRATLVFLHYFGGAAASWHWVAHPLAEQYNCRCVALNLPGFGSTPPPETVSISAYAEFIAQTLAQQGISNYILIGHSMGGKLALQVTAASDSPPQQMVLIAPSPATTEPMPEEEKQRMISNHPSRENAETTLNNAAKKSLTTEQRELAINTHMSIEMGVWKWWLRQGMENSIADQVRSLSTPVTVLASKDDPVIPFDAIQTDVIDILPNATLIATEGSGHLIPLEDPEWVVKQIAQLL